MGSLAILAKEAGFEVFGSDGKIYPPMSKLLKDAEIDVHEGFDASLLQPPPDTVVIGNANLPRGSESLEYVLNHGLHYESGAEWLGRNILHNRHVIAVAGTHGKTTTASMLAWILEHADLSPGYLIGGAPKNFETSARLGTGQHFVIEADEYDTSYFDRRAKFMHYRPQTLLINNIEYDHADIYPNLEAIQYQFHHLIRTVPGNGRIIVPLATRPVDEVLKQGCWSNLTHTTIEQALGNASAKDLEDIDCWHANPVKPDWSETDIHHNQIHEGRLNWKLLGKHNVSNALQAIAAAYEAGVTPSKSLDALSNFKGIKRRMEVFAKKELLTFYDDFAHHPTAIKSTLQGLRDRVGRETIVAVIEPRTHTMQMGTHREALQSCCRSADQVFWFKSEQVSMDLAELIKQSDVPSKIFDDLDKLIETLCQTVGQPTHVVLMSNGGFGNIYEKIRERLY